MTDALLYARISKLDANVPKVALQLENLKELAARRGYSVVGEYVDDGISAAKAENRPSFDRLLVDLPEHPGAVILATEEARLSRNTQEKLALQMISTKYGVTWETMRDGVVDPAQAAGEFMSTIRGAVDTFEGKRKAERQRQANADRRKEGLPQRHGSVPFGWNNDRLTLNEPHAALIRDGIAMILDGKSLASVRNMWRDSGINPPRGKYWETGSVKTLITRPRNAALVEHKGEIIGEGVWEPIVTKRELEQVRTLLSANSREKTPVKFLLSGIAVCSCGMKMFSNGDQPARYVCSGLMKGIADPTQKHATIKGQYLEDEVRLSVCMHYFIDRNAGAESDADALELADLYDSLARNAEKQSELANDYYGDDPILSRTQFAKKNSDLMAQEADLNSRITALSARNAHAAMLTEARRLLHAGSFADGSDIRPVLDELYQRYDALSFDEKRTLIRATVSVQVNPVGSAERMVVDPLKITEPFAFPAEQ